MDSSECCKEKLSQNLLPRQSKPFIDKNLQLQIPERDKGHANRSLSPIYSHYIGDSPSLSNIAPQVNEGELYKAMKDAEQSYQAWQEMKEQISKASLKASS